MVNGQVMDGWVLNRLEGGTWGCVVDECMDWRVVDRSAGRKVHG